MSEVGAGHLGMGIVNGVIESGEEVVPLGFSERRFGLILFGLVVNGGLNHGHELTSHRISRYPTWDGRSLPPIHAAVPMDSLGLFDRINLAQCAAKRAELNAFSNERFTGEFETARSWTRYRCFITSTVSFIETN